jgi:hypothetical protein
VRVREVREVFCTVCCTIRYLKNQSEIRSLELIFYQPFKCAVLRLEFLIRVYLRMNIYICICYSTIQYPPGLAEK